MVSKLALFKYIKRLLRHRAGIAGFVQIFDKTALSRKLKIRVSVEFILIVLKVGSTAVERRINFSGGSSPFFFNKILRVRYAGFETSCIR